MKWIFTFAALYSLCVCAPALAAPSGGSAFGDCNDASYLAGFDSRMKSDHDFLCTEVGSRIPVATDAGTVHIRIIKHVVGDWAAGPGTIAAVRHGATAAAAAMSRLGSFNLHNTTILLGDGFPPPDGDEKFGDFAAWTQPAGDECRVVLWLLGPGGSAENAESVIAHELFHCVEGATLSSGQMDTAHLDNARWWSEGAAEWFATLAVPAPPYMQDRVNDFDADSPDKPLYAMSYAAMVFFDWLGGAQGPGAVLPFLHQMASSASPAAQQAAMAGALSAEDWLQFAQDYLDRNIHDGQGQALNSTPGKGNAWTWTKTQTRRIALKPFVLRRGIVDFACGKWSVQDKPRRFHAARPASGGNWGALPETIDTRSGDNPHTFRFAAMDAQADPATAVIPGTRKAACQGCDGMSAIDHRIVGHWVLTAGGTTAWLMANAAPQVGSYGHVEAHHTGPKPTLTLNADGSYTMTNPGKRRMSGWGKNWKAPPDTFNGFSTWQSSGEWAAKGGHLHLCGEAGGLHGHLHVTYGEGGSDDQPININKPGHAVQTYSVAGDTLNTEQPIHGLPPITFTYTRQTGGSGH